MLFGSELVRGDERMKAPTHAAAGFESFGFRANRADQYCEFGGRSYGTCGLAVLRVHSAERRHL